MLKLQTTKMPKVISIYSYLGGTGKSNLTIAISHVLLLILHPDKQDYQGTAIAVDIAQQLKVRKMLLIINQVLESMNTIALKKKVEEAYNTTVAAIFPLSEDVVKLASEGVFCLKYSDHPLTQEFLSFTRQIIE